MNLEDEGIFDLWIEYLREKFRKEYDEALHKAQSSLWYVSSSIEDFELVL